ncbi:MAG: plastocyanin/azurin family copper-binding protein [Dehalococcoidia bacterium]
MYFMTRRHALTVLAALMGVVASGLAPDVAVAGGGCRGFASTEASGDAVQMEGTCFVPTVLRVEPGTNVTWTNQSTEPHSVAGATIEWGNYNELKQGQTIEYTFDRPGTYPYYCFVHNGMIGTIVVGDGVRTDAGDSANVSARVPLDTPPETPAGALATKDVSAGTSTRDSLLFSGLGVLIGATLVAVGFGIRELRAR